MQSRLITTLMTSGALALGAVSLGGCARGAADETIATAGTPTASATPAASVGRVPGRRALPNPKVGGAAMYANKSIVENAMASPIHTTLVAAVKQAGLVDTLNGPGPFTVFAPTNTAFGYQDQATLAALMQPAAQEQLKGILIYHVVPGVHTTQELMAMIKAAPGGVATLTTVNGADLRIMMEGSNIVVMGANGSKGYINPTERNVRQSNGMIQVINGVLLPPQPM